MVGRYSCAQRSSSPGRASSASHGSQLNSAEPGHRLGRRQPHAVGDRQLRAADHLQIRRWHQPRRPEGRGRRDALYQPVVRRGLGPELEAGLRRANPHRHQARAVPLRRGLRHGGEEPHRGLPVLLPPRSSWLDRLRHRRHGRGLPAPGIFPLRRNLGRRGLRRHPRPLPLHRPGTRRGDQALLLRGEVLRS